MPKANISNLRVPYALAVHDEQENKKILAVLNEHRTNTGRETYEFEERSTKYFGKKYATMVNSGSSANLLAFELLDLPEGSEIITPLLTFSTTVSPILKKGLVPVFADVTDGSYQIDVDQIEQLITNKTKALMIPLLLGNVPDMKRLKKLAKKYKLYFIEDSCDTYGAKYANKPTGTYSDITTTSFFGSHIITAAGNGGMILVNKPQWHKRAKVLRGWGRDSSIFQESEDITKRFAKKLGNLPYDAKFIFSEIGYNFLPCEISAAFANAQLDKLDKFRKTRIHNFSSLYNFFKNYEDLFILPKQDVLADTQWLAFPLTIKKNAPFNRLEIVTFLEKNNIQTRPIFTGNILRQPGFKKIPHRIAKNNCPITNDIMERGFIVGCHHGMNEDHLEKLKRVFVEFLK
ncbi:aminotransferase class I/II-fold pyridoxal phosphate-dependent enzyme [Candidatus Roizmanbacteria bacterium]|nr:aminotransferase class I/II-fold pyridoxal phosphate-dependent enzyme [Candidatus Roizmanbacteria bacterium]